MDLISLRDSDEDNLLDWAIIYAKAGEYLVFVTTDLDKSIVRLYELGFQESYESMSLMPTKHVFEVGTGSIEITSNVVKPHFFCKERVVSGKDQS
jgi:predicted trehalose synthase